MVYTVNLRQLNFLLQQFEAFVDAHGGGDDVFMSRLAESVKDFLEQTRELRIDGLDNQTDRSLSLFRPEGHREDDREPVDGEMYSRVYRISFACLAQAQRHRTISYTILGSIEKNADDLYIPPVVKKAGLEKEWVSDLKEVAKDDFPQAQLISVYERGRMEDFRSKALLRICGHAQLEVMYNTLETAQQLKEYQRRYGIHSLQPKCLQGIRCASPCVWLGGNALKRVV